VNTLNALVDLLVAMHSIGVQVTEIRVGYAFWRRLASEISPGLQSTTLYGVPIECDDRLGAWGMSTVAVPGHASCGTAGPTQVAA
jgi:hypothetical protein